LHFPYRYLFCPSKHHNLCCYFLYRPLLTLEGTFSPGTTKELTATEKIEFVTVGNAGGITVTLNGKNVPSLGTSGQVVRNVVLNKDTLTQISTQTQTQTQTAQGPQTSAQPQ
jgi:hypothetical protein